MLSRDLILQAKDLKVSEPVLVPEWDGNICYRALSVKEQREWEDSIASKDESGKILASTNAEEVMTKLLVRSICDDQGSLIFRPEDYADLCGKNGDVVKRIYDLVCKHCGIGQAGRKAAEGNLTGPASDSSSRSAGPSVAPSQNSASE